MAVKTDLLVKKQLVHQGYNLVCHRPKKDATDGSICGEYYSAISLRRHIIGRLVFSSCRLRCGSRFDRHHEEVMGRNDFVIRTDSERSQTFGKPLTIEMVDKLLKDRYFLTGMPILKTEFFP